MHPLSPAPAYIPDDTFPNVLPHISYEPRPRSVSRQSEETIVKRTPPVIPPPIITARAPEQIETPPSSVRTIPSFHLVSKPTPIMDRSKYYTPTTRTSSSSFSMPLTSPSIDEFSRPTSINLHHARTTTGKHNNRATKVHILQPSIASPQSQNSNNTIVAPQVVAAPQVPEPSDHPIKKKEPIAIPVDPFGQIATASSTMHKRKNSSNEGTLPVTVVLPAATMSNPKLNAPAIMLSKSIPSALAADDKSFLQDSFMSKHPRTWTVANVTRWMVLNDLAAYTVGQSEAWNVDGEILMRMDPVMLNSLSIPASSEEGMLLLQLVQNLRSEWSLAPSLPPQYT
ncbi:hypothetical protein HDU97_001406 [Phlyctochytrium planicorne]|nr:hypothetical protein HDU97_001406 [Phlyctochytrium planicorne]